MFNRNTSKLMAFGFALVVLVSGFSIALAAGGVAAQEDTTVLVDSEFIPENTTDSAYVDITGVSDMAGSGPVAVDVTYTGLMDGEDVANGTVLNTETLSVSEGNMSSSTYDVTDSDTEFDAIHVEVNVQTDGEEDLIESVDWGTLEEMAGGGGGGLLSGSVGGVPIVGVLGVLVLVWFVKGRD